MRHVILYAAIILLIVNLYTGLLLQLKVSTLNEREARIEKYDEVVVHSLKATMAELAAAKSILVLSYQFLLDIDAKKSRNLYKLIQILDSMRSELGKHIKEGEAVLRGSEKVPERAVVPTKIPTNEIPMDGTMHGIGGTE